MKKCFALLLLLPLGFGGCDDGHEPRTETWTVAPETVSYTHLRAHET